MALLELCLLPLLSPQDPAAGSNPPATPPAATAPAPTEPAPAPEPEQSPEERELLLAAEQKGVDADVTVLARLTGSEDETIAARAAWLLGRAKDPHAVAMCSDVAAQSPHVSVRTQAMAALLARGGNDAVPAALKGLEDSDRTVRTLAAQVLGKRKRPAAIEPLLALLDRSREDASTEPATDVQAALLALHDLEAKDHLLRAATAIHDGKVAGTGAALAFCFQSLSPRLERAQEVTTLLAVLDHREPFVRRYALGRLADLGDPTTVNALEGRLKLESPELKPLVEAALAQVRKDHEKPPTDELERALGNVQKLGATAKARWAAMDTTQRWLAGSAPVVLLALLVLAARRRRRREAEESAAATAALVAPSEEYLEEVAAEVEELVQAAEQLEVEPAPEADEAEAELHGAAR